MKSVISMGNDRSKAIKQAQHDAAQRGRRSGPRLKVSDAQIREVMHLGTTQAAHKVGLSRAQYIVRRRRLDMMNDEVKEKVATQTLDGLLDSATMAMATMVAAAAHLPPEQRDAFHDRLPDPTAFELVLPYLGSVTREEIQTQYEHLRARQAARTS